MNAQFPFFSWSSFGTFLFRFLLGHNTEVLSKLTILADETNQRKTGELKKKIKRKIKIATLLTFKL